MSIITLNIQSSQIHGEPKYESLCTMQDELKSNSMTVSTTLDRGQHDHLSLTMLTADYTPGVSPTPYVRPVHSGPLVIPARITQHKATRRHEDHRAAVKLFRETETVKRSLIKQILGCIDAVYLKAIDLPLVNVLDHLFTRYGSVGQETLDKYDEKVRMMKYHPSNPLVQVFNAIEELEHLSRAAQKLYSDNQKVQIGLKIIKRTIYFVDRLKEWYQLPIANQTCVTFKTHFQDTQELLQKIRGTDMTSELIQQENQANLINVV